MTTPVQYRTYTNDPLILELVKQYRAARAAADAAAQRSIDAGIGDLEAAAEMQAKQAELSTIQTRLCVMFVGGLDQNKEQ